MGASTGGAAPMNHPARLTIGVVGAGRVGAVLGAALAGAGHRVIGWSGVAQASYDRAAALLPGVPRREPDELARRADLLLLAVPEDVMADLVSGLAATGAVRPGQLVVHTAGRFGIDVLGPATRLGALPIALHPVVSFTGTAVDLLRLRGAMVAVTAPLVLRPVAQALVLEMGSECEFVAEPARPLLHAALAQAADHLTTLVAESAELLSACGVSDPARMLAPLLQAAVENALRSGDRALAGPVVRADAETVGAHLAAIGTISPRAAAAYRAMARLTADRALAAGLLPAEQAAGLLEVLGDPVLGDG